jgi:hypothetical protein
MQFRMHGQVTITEDVQLLIKHKSRLIQRRLIHVRDDLKALDVAFARRHRDGAFIAKLVLTIPDRILAVRGDGPTLPSALDEAFDALGDRLDENLARLGRVPLIRRQQLAYRRPSEQMHSEEAQVEMLEEADEIGIEWEELVASSSAGLGSGTGEAERCD